MLKGLSRGPKSFFKREPYMKPLQDKIQDLNLDYFFSTLQDVGDLNEGLPVRSSRGGRYAAFYNALISASAACAVL